MVQGELAKYFLAMQGEAHVNFAPVLCAPISLNKVFLFEAANQLDRTVMLNLQALSQVSDARAVAASRPAQRQHELMMLGLDTHPASCLLAKVQKAANLITKLGQAGVIGLL